MLQCAECQKYMESLLVVHQDIHLMEKDGEKRRVCWQCRDKLLRQGWKWVSTRITKGGSR